MLWTDRRKYNFLDVSAPFKIHLMGDSSTINSNPELHAAPLEKQEDNRPKSKRQTGKSRLDPVKRN